MVITSTRRRISCCRAYLAIASCTPCPIARLAASTNAPKSTPSSVSSVRTFCCHSAARAKPRMSRQRTDPLPCLTNDLPVPQPHDPLGAVPRQLFVVRHEDERGAMLVDVGEQEGHHL